VSRSENRTKQSILNEFMRAARDIGRSELDWLAAEFRIKRQEDWYGLTRWKLKEKGFDDEFAAQLPARLHAGYPEYLWRLWLLSDLASVKKDYWKEEQNQREYLDWLNEQLDIRNHEGWYNVSPELVKKLHGAPFLELYDNSLSKGLRCLLSEHKWKF